VDIKTPKICDCCSGQSSSLITVENNYPIVRCNTCGLIYVGQHPPEKDGKVIGEYYVGGEAERTYKAYERVNTFLAESITHYFPEKGTFLDVGCGYGHLISMMMDRGWSGHGSELSQLAVNYVNNKFGKEVVQYGDIPALSFSDGSFTAINLTNVLEHVPSPTRTLLDCRNLLKQDGALFIRVPNMDFSFAFNRVYRLMNLFGLKFKSYSIIAWQPPFHLTGFDSRTLVKVLQKTEFDVLYVGPSTLTAGKGYYVAEVLAKLLYTITLGRINLCPTLLCVAKKR
jgi:SAM-dependent methyltransferase